MTSSQLVDDTGKTDKPIVIAFRPQAVKEYFEKNNITDDSYSDWPVRVISCYSFKELNKALDTKPVLIMAGMPIIEQHGSVEEFLLMLDTLMKFSEVEVKPSIGIGFNNRTSVETIKKMQKLSIAGVFPSLMDYGPDELRAAIESFLLTGRSYPKHLIDRLPGHKVKQKHSDIHLTGRQRQVYELIARRGLSNKQIAQVLRISESTVKIHVSAVMRAMCVRNRTQLALTK